MTVEVEYRVRHCGGDFRAPFELPAGQDITSVNTCFLPAPPVILSRRRRISVPAVNDPAAGHARARYSPSCPLVLTAFTLTYHAYRDPSLALRMTCVRREGFVFYAARRPVISSGAACRDGGSGIGTIDTESRDLLLHCGMYHLRRDFGAPLPTVEMTVEVECRVRYCGGISGLRLS